MLAAVVGIYNGASVVNLVVEAMVVIIDVVDVGRASSIFRGKAKHYSSIQKTQNNFLHLNLGNLCFKLKNVILSWKTDKDRHIDKV